MRLGCSLLLVLPISLLRVQLNAQEVSAQPSGAKLCVAVVNNRSPELLDQDRMTARLVKALADKKLSAVTMDSVTGNSKDLRPTLENSQEMKSKECDYLVLTMVTKPYPRDPTSGDAQISIGHARVPSVDASDPMGGQSGPVYRNELNINFAVFRPGNIQPVLDMQIYDRPRASASDSLMDGMDQEGSKIKHVLKKK